jgi:hypothetical protein
MMAGLFVSALLDEPHSNREAGGLLWRRDMGKPLRTIA